LIAGCGQIGTRVGLEWARRGASVVGVRRSAGRIPQPIIAESADFTNPEALARVMGRHGPFDVIYFIATPDSYDDEGYRRAYVEGVWTLCEVIGLLSDDPPWPTERGSGAGAGGASAAPRLIFVSSTGVYGQEQGEWVDETSPTEPTSYTGRRLLEAEQIVAAATAGGRVQGVSLRLGGIYGPGRDMLIARVRAGAPCHAEPVRYTNRIHEDDAVGALVHLGAIEAPAAVYNGVDHEAAADCDVADFIAERLGLPRPERRRSGSAPLVGVRGGNKRVSSERLRDRGYAFVFPTFREGYAELLG